MVALPPSSHQERSKLRPACVTIRLGQGMAQRSSRHGVVRRCLGTAVTSLAQCHRSAASSHHTSVLMLMHVRPASAGLTCCMGKPAQTAKALSSMQAGGRLARRPPDAIRPSSGAVHVIFSSQQPCPRGEHAGGNIAMAARRALRIMRTHSVASVSADVVTSSGCTTASSSILLTAPLRTLMPAAVSPCAAPALRLGRPRRRDHPAGGGSTGRPKQPATRLPSPA